MGQEAPPYDFAAIRQRLHAAFTVKTLRRFCHDHPDFRPVYDSFSPDHGLNDLVDRVIEYCEKWGRLDQLLTEVERLPSGQYARPEPDLRSAEEELYMAPRRLPEFVGRKGEIKQVTRALKPGKRTAITGLVAMGGMGKTELAKVAAYRVARRFRDGVLWADCGQQDLETIADLWAGELRVQLHGDDEDSKIRSFCSLINSKEALLVFDNVQPDKHVEPLFPARGRSAVLITTRYEDHPDLQGAQRLLLDQFTEEEAMDLVAKVLGRDAARRQAAEATHLFGLLGYLPLAVNVALQLARAKKQPLADLNKTLEEAGAMEVLGQQERRKKSLDATFQTAWNNLPADLQETFAALALFNAGPSFSTEALADTLALEQPEALARLRRLAARSLLTASGERRWSLHPLLREFASTRGPLPEDAAAHMAGHYLAVLAATHNLYLQGGEDVLQGLALFDLERAHIEAGQAWAAQHTKVDDVAALYCSEFPRSGARCLHLRLAPRVLIGWLEAARAAAYQLGNDELVGINLGYLGNAYADLGDLGEALAHYQRALAIAQEIGDRRSEGIHLGNLGNVYTESDPKKAIDFYEEALAIAREIDDRRAEGQDLGNLGNAFANLGLTQQAIGCYEEALEIHCETGDRRGEGFQLGNLGVTYEELGDERQAINYYHRALTIAKEIGDRRREAKHSWNLGRLYEESDPARAIALMEVCVAYEREIGHPDAEAHALRVDQICARLHSTAEPAPGADG